MEPLSSAPMMIHHFVDSILSDTQTLDRQERSVDFLSSLFCVNVWFSQNPSERLSVHFLFFSSACSASCIRTDSSSHIWHCCFKIAWSEICMSRAIIMDLIQSRFNYTVMTSMMELTWPCGRDSFVFLSFYFLFFCGAVTLGTRSQLHQRQYKVMAVMTRRMRFQLCGKRMEQ